MGGAISWPALSESTRPVLRSSDSSEPISEGSASSSQAPIISQPPQRQANSNSHANPTANNTNRQRSRYRSGGSGGGSGSASGSGPSHNTSNRPPSRMSPPFPFFEVPYGRVPPTLDASVTGTRPVVGVGGSQSHTGNENSSQRNTSRWGNYGHRSRGDGPHHNNQGVRRDQDRRDVHLPPQYMPPPYMPPLVPGATPFMATPPVRVFSGQMGFDVPSPFFYVPTLPPESYRAMPIVPSPPPMFFPPANDNPLMNMIAEQIDYYFSEDNLARDNFLRSKMDELGWVPVSLIASFPRIQQLTKDIPLVLESLRYSTNVEVQGDKVRCNEWNRWLHTSSGHNSDSGPQPQRAAAPEDVLSASLQEISLDHSMTNARGNTGNYESHSELTGQSRLVNGEDTE